MTPGAARCQLRPIENKTSRPKAIPRTMASGGQAHVLGTARFSVAGHLDCAARCPMRAHWARRNLRYQSRTIAICGRASSVKNAPVNRLGKQFRDTREAVFLHFSFFFFFGLFVAQARRRVNKRFPRNSTRRRHSGAT